MKINIINKKTYLIITTCIIIFSSCTPKLYIYLKNNTDNNIYFDTGAMGIRNPLLKPDSSILIGGGVWKYKNRELVGFGPQSLLITSGNDTIILKGDPLKYMVDSLWLQSKSSGITLEIMDSWFDKFKK